MRVHVPSLGVGLVIGLLGAAAVAGSTPHVFPAPTGHVLGVEGAQVKKAPSGKARVMPLAGPALGGSNEAFVAVLEIDAGAGVPQHRDATAEYVYVLEGGGEITIGGKKRALSPGDLVYMPPDAEVSFANGAARSRVLQVFAPPGPEAKYAGWGAAP